MKRRSLPSLSRRCGLSAGKLVSISAINWGRFCAVDCISRAPFVCLWKAFGNTTLTDINFLSLLDHGLEVSQTGTNRVLRFEAALQHIHGLQAVAGNRNHGQIAGINTAASIQPGSHRRGHSPCRFCKDPLGLSQFLNCRNNLYVGNIFSPTTTFVDRANGVGSVGGISDGQRARNGIWPLRLVMRQTILDRMDDGGTASGLGSEKAHRLVFYQAELN